MPTKLRIVDNRAYCVKCQRKVEMQGAEVVELSNGRLANSGYCPYCGTECYRFIKG